jgi:streptogramin lyase
VVAEIPVAANPTAVAAGLDAVWVATADGRVLVVDPKRNRVADSVDAGGPSLGFTQTITVGAGGVWLAEPLAEQVVRIDPRTGRVVARIPAGAATTVAVGEGGVWVVSSLGVLRIDPHRNQVVATVAAAELRRAMVVTTGGGAVWAASWSSVARIDPRRVRG